MRRSCLVPVIFAVAFALWLGGCDSSTEPAPEVRIAATTPTALTGTAGAEVVPAPSVRVTDERDRPLAGVAISFKVVSGGGTVAGSNVTTDGNGSASLSRWTLGSAAGTQTLKASTGDEPGVVFTAVAAAGPVAQVTASSGNNQLVGVGKDVEKPLVALAVDAFGNPVTGAPIVFAVVAGGGTIAGGPVMTDSTGHATAGQWTLGAEEGLQYATAVSASAQAVFRAYAVAPPGELQGQIAFTSWDDPYLNIAVVNADGGGRMELSHPGRGISPEWSPDGSLIAFAPDAPDEHDASYGIGLMAADGASVSWLDQGAVVADPAWSPDGAAIVHSRVGIGIASISTANGSVAALIAGPGSNILPSWSPDGQKLAFVSDRDGAPNIYIANADGTGQARLTDDAAGPGSARIFWHPAWSPDGSMIAFVYGDVTAGQNTRFLVAVMAANGTVLKTLTSAGIVSSDSRPGSLAWSPDGRGIAYTFYGCDSQPDQCTDPGFSVRYVSLDGSLESTIADDAMSPSWRR